MGIGIEDILNFERGELKEADFGRLGTHIMIVKLVQSASRLYEDHNLKEKYGGSSSNE